ncbi:MAG: C39 family peptidase [Candidatus Staskawiczbacteria bacterium]|nr:C39 family peptidase [Candidatus Staskawiczbacteria bacterium]
MNKILLDVKPFQETLNADMCGPASLKIVLEYYGINKSEDELIQLCKFKKGLGVDDKGIKTAAEKFGLKAVIKNNSSFKDVEKWLTRGTPVIVNWFTRGRTDYGDSSVADGHYSVVMGLDDSFIYLQDPELGAMRKIERNNFMRVWFDFKGEYIKPKDLIIRQAIAIHK